MAQYKQHNKLNECKPCVVLMVDTFAGALSDRHPNNCRYSIEKPLEYFEREFQELNSKLRSRLIRELYAKAKREGKEVNPIDLERAKSTSYTKTIKVNPKDHRSFLSAEFRYGRRVVTYTNVSSIAHNRTQEKTSYCAKDTNITATRYFKVSRSMKKWAEEHAAAWKKAGYRGKFHENITAKGTFVGEFNHSKEDKHISVTSRFTSKTTITITLVQTYTVTENLYSKEKPQNFVKTIHEDMIKNKFQGEVRTHVNSFGKLIIDGQYTKTTKVDHGTNAYEILFYNQTTRAKSIPVEGSEDWKPTKKVGNTFIQVRSIAQDDQYTPEFRGKKINWDRIEIEKLYKEYMQMPANELELSQKRLEAKDERAATKGDKTALKWLRSLKKSRPSWLQAPNSESLVLYCVKYLKQEVMTISEANNFCKNNAYKNTSV